MVEKKDGGLAFPGSRHEFIEGGQPMKVEHSGLTMRDYFAAKAMQACLSSTGMIDAVFDSLEELGLTTDDTPRVVADVAYAYADAMIAARDA